jgi:predicted HicB family RNase H-like nuclease
MPAKPRKPAVVTTIRFDPEVKEAAEIAAAADGRTLSSLVQKIVSDWLRERKFVR